MKKYSILLFAAIAVSVFSCTTREETMDSLINDRLDRSVKHYKALAASLIDQPSKIPQSTDKQGNLLATVPAGWVSGFAPGSLWYLYQYSNDTILLEYARNYTARLEQEKYNRNTHDLGFMMYCSFGNGYRITGDSAYKTTLLTGAESLSSRYNPLTGSIQSWNANDKWQFPVIIDNMMNLEFLFWAARTSGENKYRDICISHAGQTIKNHFRPDYGSYHVISYDTVTGMVEKKNTHQGYDDESTWARGQAWALYGFTLMYRETKDPVYLAQAKQIAAYILNHPHLPADKIPYWDFDAPDIPHALRDASAGAIMASAFIELNGYVDDNQSKEYLDVAEKQLRTLSSPGYFAEEGTNGNFILKHSVGYMHGNLEIDVPLSYADYYYIEALLRYRDLPDQKKAKP